MGDELIESFDKAWEKVKETVKEWGEDITSIVVYTPHGRIELEFSPKTRQHEAGWRMTGLDELGVVPVDN